MKCEIMGLCRFFGAILKILAFTLRWRAIGRFGAQMLHYMIYVRLSGSLAALMRKNWNRTRVEVGRPVAKLWEKIQVRDDSYYSGQSLDVGDEKWSDSGSIL